MGCRASLPPFSSSSLRLVAARGLECTDEDFELCRQWLRATSRVSQAGQVGVEVPDRVDKTANTNPRQCGHENSTFFQREKCLEKLSQRHLLNRIDRANEIGPPPESKTLDSTSSYLI